jgi:glycosyltransferase involved in cell wall biosynthesis
VVIEPPPAGLRVALLTYRGNPRSGGQGVYVRHLSQALTRLGHQVTVMSGPPYPELGSDVSLTRLPSLDLYRPEAPFRAVRPPRNALDLVELATMCAGGFPEPLTFSFRAWAELRRRRREFDVVHDNQGLGYGLLGVRRLGLPLLATVHHPVQVDLRLELAHAHTRRRRFALRRWYGFTRMQGRVARRLPRLLTVSKAARAEIVRELGVEPARIAVVPNGVDTDLFRPAARTSGASPKIIATASADVPLKGLDPLLRAFARVRRVHAGVELTIVGQPRPDGPTPRLLRELDLGDSVRFVSGLSDAELAQLCGSADLAVVPSLYEGFSLPAAEAMACGLPLVATTAGGLPEVVGADGEAALLVPPGDPLPMAGAISALLADPGLRRRMGEHGRARVLTCFTWEAAARATVERYQEAITPPPTLAAQC